MSEYPREQRVSIHHEKEKQEDIEQKGDQEGDDDAGNGKASPPDSESQE